jgi:uncharacterized membrane protein YhaH (DUF805 family)
MNWFVTALQKFLDFKGRAQRAEYWFFVLFYVLLSFPVAFIATMTGYEDLNLIYALGLLLPSLAVAARRLHDTGRSGWIQAAPIGAAGVSGFTGAIAFSSPTSAGFLVFGLAVAAFIVAQGMLVYFLVKDSDPGDNKFGPNPKAEPQL